MRPRKTETGGAGDLFRARLLPWTRPDSMDVFVLTFRGTTTVTRFGEGTPPVAPDLTRPGCGCAI
jgi:hypothetical protein